MRKPWSALLCVFPLGRRALKAKAAHRLVSIVVAYWSWGYKKQPSGYLSHFLYEASVPVYTWTSHSSRPVPHPTEATAEILAALTCSAKAARQQGFGRTHSSSESQGRSSSSSKVEISERMASASPVEVAGNAAGNVTTTRVLGSEATVISCLQVAGNAASWIIVTWYFVNI